MAAILVTLTQAKAHLRIPTAMVADDVDIQLKLNQAEAIILDYLSGYVDAAWVGPSTAPAPVSAAILIMLAHLHENRGDAMGGGNTSGEADAMCWAAIERLLMRTRNPAIA